MLDIRGRLGRVTGPAPDPAGFRIAYAVAAAPLALTLPPALLLPARSARP
ncbi:hypothetical protein ACWEQC_42140 [Streptomyces shenzhenensis]